MSAIAPKTLPAPLVPPEVDLRGLEFMPLRGDILFKSTTWLKGSPAARCAALRLWWHAFAHEVPAASLPDDNRLLATHAGCSPKEWRRVREQAMRGWVKCSDGRFHHRVVAELALAAWKGRTSARERLKNFRKRKDETVSKRLRNVWEGEGELEREGEGEGDSVSHAPLGRAAVGRATAIADDWQPSAQAIERLRTARPDLTQETLDRRLVEFRAWCAANNRTTFNPDATWLGFMVKTHEQRSPPTRTHANTHAHTVDDALSGYARRAGE